MIPLKRTVWLVRFVVGLVTFVLAAPAFALPPQREGPAQGNYRIGVGDVLEIVVWKNAELTRMATVRPDGWISLPLLNDIRATGHTPMALQQIVTERLKEFVTEPVVSIIVTEVHSFSVSVLGKVRSPGRFQLAGPTSVLDILAMAGGFEEFSSPDDIYILRSKGGSYDRLKLDYRELTKPKGKGINIPVRSGDVIIVP